MALYFLLLLEYYWHLIRIFGETNETKRIIHRLRILFRAIYSFLENRQVVVSFWINFHFNSNNFILKDIRIEYFQQCFFLTSKSLESSPVFLFPIENIVFIEISFLLRYNQTVRRTWWHLSRNLILKYFHPV